MRVLTAEQSKAFDRWAIEGLGVPSMVLMENAAVGVCDAALELMEQCSLKRCVVLCGPGNNGGDGYAVARQLHCRGVEVRCFQLGSMKEDTDGGRQRSIVEGLGIETVDTAPGEEDLSGEVLVVDALFGTGLSRPLEGDFADLVERLGRSGATVLAVDVPSGVDASSGSLPGPAVRARRTVSMAAPKIAHVLRPAAVHCGEVLVTDLGVRFAEKGDGPYLNLSTSSAVAAALPERPQTGHKGTYGHVLVVGGSRGLDGAALLTTRAAVRGGAGLVTLALPDGVAVAGSQSLESMTLPVGTGCERYAPEHVEAVLGAAAERDVVVLGPGLGRSDETVRFVRRLLERLEAPCVLDADALWALEGCEGARSAGPWILTPHPGELARLLGTGVEEIEADRLAAVRRAAAAAEQVVVLKGSGTLVSEPDGEAWIDVCGGPVLATGGTGDVLAGLVAALLAQGVSTREAAVCGVHIHAATADRLAERRARVGLGAGEICDALPESLERLYRLREEAERSDG